MRGIVDNYSVENIMRSSGLLWEQIIEKLKENIPEQTYKTWFVPAQSIEFNDDILVIGVPNPFFIDWLEEHYIGMLNDAAFNILKRRIKISFKAQAVESVHPEIALKEIISYPTPRTNLRAKYTFENFVVGKSNQFAQAASLAVAKVPAKTYNPLLYTVVLDWGKRILCTPLVIIPFLKTIE